VNYYEKKRLVGLYGDISLGYKDMLFINVTGRNDWSSTLPINNRSYFYPSISGSFIFTELMENKDILNYGKIRLSYVIPLLYRNENYLSYNQYYIYKTRSYYKQKIVSCYKRRFYLYTINQVMDVAN
jgi:hypothetical protein